MTTHFNQKGNGEEQDCSVLSRDSCDGCFQDRDIETEAGHRDGKGVGNADERATFAAVDSTSITRSMFRNVWTSCLPPPMVASIGRLDLILEPYMGPEPSSLLLGSILFYFGFAYFLRLIFSKRMLRSKATLDDGFGHKSQSTQERKDFDFTVALCGPVYSGKTNLFYQLVGNPPYAMHDGESFPDLPAVMTVKSILQNTGYWDASTAPSVPSGLVIRALDIPGQFGSRDVATVLREHQVDRVVLVLDSTQPVSKGADYLYALLLSSMESPTILVACHKSDSPRAKNCRRVKLQLRNELERLNKLLSNKTNADGAPLTMDWDKLFATSSHVGFLETSSCLAGGDTNSLGINELRRYCETGEIPITT